MTEYEKAFTDHLYETLRERVKGKVTVFVSDNVLYIRVKNHELEYEKKIEDFANKIYNGFTSEYALYLYCKEFRSFINYLYFR